MFSTMVDMRAQVMKITRQYENTHQWGLHMGEWRKNLNTNRPHGTDESHGAYDPERRLPDGAAQAAASSKRLETSGQLTTFHQAAM